MTSGSLRVLWDSSETGQVSITGESATWYVGGNPVSFPYNISTATTFVASRPGKYTLSVELFGVEIANTPDGTKDFEVQDATQQVVAPSIDAAPSSNDFLGKIGEIVGATGVAQTRTDTPALYDDFSTDTSAGSAGTPINGPGGAWVVTGAQAATVRVTNGKLVSPNGVSYIYKVLNATPTYLRQNFIWRTNGSATFGICNETSLSIPSVDMVHPTVTGTFISVTVWTNGASAVLTNNGAGTNGAVSLVNGSEYIFEVFIVGDSITCTVTDAVTGTLMGRYTGSDPIVSDKVGALVYVEPGTDADVTEVWVA